MVVPLFYHEEEVFVHFAYNSKLYISFIGKRNETTGAVITWNSKSSDKGPDGQTLGTYGSATVGLILIFSVPPRIQWLQCLVEMECKQWH
ncbi:pectinesterase QRT1-like isoform X2 [Arachis ipaensis]|uniref:pectinesterase QRT1-like isoform X2 n=1 Tax=Arachis ipaensis TaxID=130454 RepID=UPI000A2B33DE|nr:pectinesterase QRT1-like isoform X2 [Arachis ipaensis]